MPNVPRHFLQFKGYAASFEYGWRRAASDPPTDRRFASAPSVEKMRSAEDAEAIVLHRVQNAVQMEPRGQYVVLP